MSQQLAPWVSAVKKAEPKFLAIQEKHPELNVSWDKEQIYVGQLMRKSEALQRCPPQSIFAAVVNVATVGLSLNPALGLAYLVPRDGQCCLDVSYRGLVQLATDSGAIRYVRADVVYENDDFTWCGLDERPEHKFKAFSKDRGSPVGVYCYAKTSDGDILSGMMSFDEVEAIRAISKAKNSPAWGKHWGEMAKKVLIKREQKLWPKAAREMVAKALGVINEHEGLQDDQMSHEPVEHYAQVRRRSDPVPDNQDDPDSTESDPGNEPIEGEFEEVTEKSGDSDAPMAMNEGTQRILGRKLKACNIEEPALFKAFGVAGWAELYQTQAAEIMEWIDGEKSG
jgi:recombination protein RecT